MVLVSRWRSHCFTWGYGRLLSLLVRLPGDLSSKQRMAETCGSHGYWVGYLHLCRELQQRTEAFSTICYLDDISLLEDPEGRSKIFSLHQRGGKKTVEEVKDASVLSQVLSLRRWTSGSC